MTSREQKTPSLAAAVLHDLRSHDGDWTRPGFRALAVYRFGVWRMKLRPKLIRAPFSLIYRFLYVYVRNTYSIELPYSAHVGRGVVIEHQGAIVIHGNSFIGDNCIIRQGVTLGIKSESATDEAPHLEDGVSVGAGAKMLGAIHIGQGARIGANAVVVKDVPAHATAVGIPARILDSKSP